MAKLLHTGLKDHYVLPVWRLEDTVIKWIVISATRIITLTLIQQLQGIEFEEMYEHHIYFTHTEMLSVFTSRSEYYFT